jgi:hypothetical protein
MRVVRTAAVLLVLTLALGAPGAFAASTSPPARAASGGEILHQLWGLLTSFWSQEGCRLDPLGGCAPAPNAGCEIDPLGKCSTSSSAKISPPPTLDEGCELDPLGRRLHSH